MAKEKKSPPAAKPEDEQGLDPNARKRILSYAAPDRRDTDSEEMPNPEAPKRRRDDRSDAGSNQEERERLED